MSITQNISEITPLSAFTSPNRPAEVDNLVENELPNLTSELIALIPQINQTSISTAQSENNAKAYRDTAKTYADESLVNKNLSLQYKTATELAYNNTQTLLSTLVIPTQATYNYQSANAKFEYKTDTFLNFRIGE